jgi:hypothetical protein
VKAHGTQFTSLGKMVGRFGGATLVETARAIEVIFVCQASPRSPLTNSRSSARNYGAACPFATMRNASSNLGWRRLHLNCSQ